MSAYACYLTLTAHRSSVCYFNLSETHSHNYTQPEENYFIEEKRLRREAATAHLHLYKISSQCQPLCDYTKTKNKKKKIKNEEKKTNLDFVVYFLSKITILDCKLGSPRLCIILN